jgi:hypothetical protein
MKNNTGTRYRIRVEGRLDHSWSAWFDGMTVAPTPHERQDSGETCIEGLVRDQAALYGLLIKIRDLNLTLIAIQRCPHDSNTETPGGFVR